MPEGRIMFLSLVFLEGVNMLPRISPRSTPTNPVITIKMIAEKLYFQKKTLIVTFSVFCVTKYVKRAIIIIEKIIFVFMPVP